MTLYDQSHYVVMMHECRPGVALLHNADKGFKELFMLGTHLEKLLKTNQQVLVLLNRIRQPYLGGPAHVGYLSE